MSEKLCKKVLLLNSSYEPISIISGKKAILMLVTDKVDYINKSSFYIKSERLKIALPVIVRLKSYVYLKRRRISLTRKNIFKRDDHKCQYCGISTSSLTIDHVIPKNKGGKDTWENLVSACVKCNLLKADFYLKDINMHLINIPKRPNFLIYMQGYVNNEYSLGYSYFDECFGITVNFKRLFYDEVDIEPTDKLTIMFSFKNLGSYKSTNLAVSEEDKQDIEWELEGIDTNEFY